MAKKLSGPPWPAPPTKHPIQVEVDREVYTGEYWDDGPDVYARLDADGTSTYAERRRDDSEKLGRTLLTELVTTYRSGKQL